MSIKKLTYLGAAVVVLTLAVSAAWWFQKRPPERPAAAPTPTSSGKPVVDIAQVQIKPLVDDTQAVGTLRSRQGVMMRPEVSGRVTQLNFKDGQRVHKGQLLVQLDDQLPAAQVQQSRAELSIAMANHSRNKELAEKNFISQRAVDESAANLDVAQAKLALAQATAARLKIVAPFDGIAGIRSVNVGDYLKDGADIVNIEDIDAVFVDFRLPERFQNRIQPGQRAGVELDALPGASFVASIQAVDPQIDSNGRSVAVRGCIDNRDLRLRPGMFARVTAVFSTREQAKVVPEESIVPLGGRSYVIRLKPASSNTWVSERVEVKLGIRRPGQVEILAGLNAGDTVVTAGQQRIQRDGTEVKSMSPASASASIGAPVSQPVALRAGTSQPNACVVRKS